MSTLIGRAIGPPFGRKYFLSIPARNVMYTAIDAGAEIMSPLCLEEVVDEFHDPKLIGYWASVITSQAQTSGATVVSHSCLYQLVKQMEP